MKIKVISTGKPKKIFLSLIEEYQKRLSGLIKNIEIIYLKEKDFDKQVIKKSEGDFLILLDEKGKEFSSKELSDLFEKWEINFGNLTFVIGPPEGHSDFLKEKADFLLSLSKLTFPHDLALVILMEVIYRAESIRKNLPYHND